MNLTATKQASYHLAALTTQKKNIVLKKLASALRKHTRAILAANTKDLKAVPADYGMRDRLTLTPARIEHMAHSLESVVKLPDPVGEVLEHSKQASGLQIERRRVPLGVIGVIYEARPNVTVEVFSLAFKTGNAVVLKGSRDADHTNQALVKIIHSVLKKAQIPTAVVQLLNPRQPGVTDALLQAHGLIDVIIPRGSERLIQFVRQTATLPVIETGAGVCHTLVEKTANIKLAVPVIANAKVRRCTVCNALDCLVVENTIAKPLYAQLAPVLAAAEVELLADSASYALLKPIYPAHLLKRASKTDYGREFLALRLAIKTVASAQDGMDFIQTHTSGHSEAILTQNTKLADQFLQMIDAAAVYVNTSTAFTDGFEFGLGAEVGISTQKLHARGPMGLTALTTYKWCIRSAGATRKP